MEHTALKLSIRGSPCFGSVDVSHEKKVPEQKQSNDNYAKSEQRLLQEAERAV
jgi:hypothetical protein